jgi:hypothetical protein
MNFGGKNTIFPALTETVEKVWNPCGGIRNYRIFAALIKFGIYTNGQANIEASFGNVNRFFPVVFEWLGAEFPSENGGNANFYHTAASLGWFALFALGSGLSLQPTLPERSDE